MHDAETIWIIGASDGIGAALAREWAARGAHLILSARSAERLDALGADLGSGHVVLALDVADRGSLERAAAAIAKTGPIDRVIHLAALYDPDKIADLDPDTANSIVSVNLTGTFHVAQLAPKLLRKGGQLALCGSAAGYFGLPQGQIYSATKAGVIGLAESLRAELHGVIDVRLISPGFVDTRLTRRNDFSMPGMISAKVAAQLIIKGLNSHHFEVHFPRRLTLGLKLLRLIPYWVSTKLTQRLVR